MAYTIVDPRDPTQDANLPSPNVYQGRPPLPPTNPFFTPASNMPAAPAPAVAPGAPLNVPVGQVASTPQPGNTNFWDVLRNLFAGPRGVPALGPAQGMTGLLMRGRGAPGTNQLGNPYQRY